MKIFYFIVCVNVINAGVNRGIVDVNKNPYNINNVNYTNRTDSVNQYDRIIQRRLTIRTKRSKEDRYLDKSIYDIPLNYCRRPAQCEHLNYTTCMGAKLPYRSTSLDLTNLETQEKVQEKLLLFQYLRFVPKCWAVIQPFLCALYMPKCENGTVDLPSKEMCEMTLEHCKIFYDSSVLPEFLDCTNKELFPPKCRNDVHELKFNTTGYCLDPLVKTDKPDWFYPDIEGCGLKCKDYLYSENEHNQIHKLIAYCIFFCLVCTLFTIVTFVIDWNTANKYPALAIFYVNVCFFISYSGWLVQFLGSETREDIVCKKDGTLRKSEPSASENLSCVVVFVMVYYFLIAAMVWFIIFSYSWHMTSLQALGKSQERVDKKRAYFHLVAWSLPLVLTITTMALGEIDADYVTGICFVGFVNMAARVGLLLTPLAAAMIAAGYINVKGLILLVKVKIESRELISEHSSSKIRSNIVRMGVFTLFMLVFCIITFIYHGYISSNRDDWMVSLNNYVKCRLTNLSSDYSNCKQISKPSVAMLQLQLLAVFGAGIAMASWIWCEATLHSWTRYIRRKFHCEVEEPMRLPKHKIIAQAFAKRKKFNEGGKISIDCQNHTDPVGLHFDLNSAASNELSTTWAANLPRLVNRRGAVPNEVTYSVSSNNQSLDSEVSLNLRHVSIESRRNSGDSQLSVQIAELKATRKVNTRRHGLTHKRDFRRRTRRLSKRNGGTKQDSSTSLDSHLQLINALTNTGSCGDEKNFGPNLNRRTGNAGLVDGHHINNLLTNGKLMIPYNRKVRSGSEDENVSVTISESKFNMVVNNLDLNDQLVIDSLRQGLHMEYIDSSTDSEDIENKDYGREKKNASKCSKRRGEYSSNSHDTSSDYDSSSCPEIKRLVQSSLNSSVGAAAGPGPGGEKNSRQSRTSIDVAVQTNSQDIELQTVHKSKRAKTKENKKYKRKDREKFRISKHFSKKGGGGSKDGASPAHARRDSNRYGDLSDEKDALLDQKNKVHIRKSKEVY